MSLERTSGPNKYRSMPIPTEISFQGCDASDQVRADVMRHVTQLERLSARLTGCQVVVHGASGRHRTGGHYSVSVRLALPGHPDIAVTSPHGERGEKEHWEPAVSEAFAAARRQLQRALEEMHDRVKQPMPAGRGRIARVLAEANGGFIETPDGREIYFHRNAVRSPAFSQLAVDDLVHFVEEDGDSGPQATVVRRVGRGAAEISRRKPA